MIARFEVLIPFLIFVEADLQLHVAPEEVSVGDLTALVYPPHRSSLEVGDVSGESQLPIMDIPRRLDPADPQIPVSGVQIGSGPAIVGDVLRIDFLRDQFNRMSGSNDPPVEMAFNLANSWIRRFRVLNRTGWARPLSQHEIPWKLAILNDDETEVEHVDGQWRRRFGSALKFQYTALDSYGWNAIKALPVSYESQPSDELLLDAYALLPQVGPAIVLAYSAIETRISQALDRIATLTGLNPTLWSWLTHRSDFTKDPSTAEQLDVVSRALTGNSLKDDAQLWERLQNLRQARNNFVHEGRPSIGRRGLTVDIQLAQQLINGAEQIIDWIENLLPQAERRPRAQSPNQVTVARLVMADSTMTSDEPSTNDGNHQPQPAEPPDDSSEIAGEDEQD